MCYGNTVLLPKLSARLYALCTFAVLSGCIQEVLESIAVGTKMHVQKYTKMQSLQLCTKML